jgi:hypothetical protein
VGLGAAGSDGPRCRCRDYAAPSNFFPMTLFPDRVAGLRPLISATHSRIPDA